MAVGYDSVENTSLKIALDHLKSQVAHPLVKAVAIKIQEVHASMHTNIHEYTNTRKHPYIHTHPYMHPSIHTPLMYMYRYKYVFMYMYTYL